MTIRELILQKQTEINNTNDLQPGRAAELLCELSAMLGNINNEILEKDIAFNKVLLGFLDSETKANRAKIKSEVSPEYQSKMEARNLKELTLEMIRSLKFYLRSKEQEFREGKF